jgi:hypothetical protein
MLYLAGTLLIVFAAGCANPQRETVNVGPLKILLPPEYALADHQPVMHDAAVSVVGQGDRELLIATEKRGESKLEPYIDGLGGPKMDRTRIRAPCNWQWGIDKNQSGTVFAAVCEAKNRKTIAVGRGQWSKRARQEIFVAIEDALNSE